MLDLELLRNPPFVAATVAAFATGAGLISPDLVLARLRGTALGCPRSGLGGCCCGPSPACPAPLARRIPPPVPGRVQLAIGLLGVGVGKLPRPASTPVRPGCTSCPGCWSRASRAGCSTPRSAARPWRACPRPGRPRQRGQQHRPLHRLRRGRDRGLGHRGRGVLGRPGHGWNLAAIVTGWCPWSAPSWCWPPGAPAAMSHRAGPWV